MRNSAEDIGAFSCPKEFKSATGAQLGFTADGVAGNQSFTGKGVAAVEYVWRNPVGEAVVWYVHHRGNIIISCFVPADAV